MAFIRDKPAHNKFAFRNLTEVDYKIQARGYSKAECQVTLVIYAWKSSAGVLYIVQGVSKGVVIDYSKRKLAGFCLALGAQVGSPVLIVFINSSRIVKLYKIVYSAVFFRFECIEEIFNLVLLPIDFALFGQPIPTGSNNLFNLLTNHFDFLNELIDCSFNSFSILY